MVQQILDVVQQINNLWTIMELEVSFTMGYLHDELKETPEQPNSKSLPALLNSYLNGLVYWVISN